MYKPSALVVSSLVSALALTLATSGLAPGQALAQGRAKASESKPDVITLVVVGDVGLNRSNYKVDARGILEGPDVLSWDELTAEVAPLIDGDLNFMNLETVVTDRNDLPMGNKGQKNPYLFRTHPEGVKKLLDLGFNLVSGANNHAYDYGEQGAKETVKHLQAITEGRPQVRYAGIGLNVDEAARAETLSVGGARVAFAAIGIVTNMLTHHRAGPDKAGTLGYRHDDDWQRSLQEISSAKGDIKLLSIHYGVERQIATDDRQRTQWREAVADHDVDVVIGHHAHVVRGIELHKGKLIFYGLGNFLIRGAADMGKKPELRGWGDYGLLAKVHFARTPKGYQVAAIEAVPMYDMHRVAHRLEAGEAGKRIEALNVLAETLDGPGSKGVRFAVRKDGSGLHCTAAAKGAAEAIATLCKDYKQPTKPSAEVRRRVNSSGRSGKRGKGKGKGKRRRR